MRSDSALQPFMDIREDTVHVIPVIPFRVIVSEALDVADPPDVIANAVGVRIAPIEFVSRDGLAFINSLKDGAIAVSSASHVINPGYAGLEIKLIKGADQIVTVNIVAHLLPLVTDDRVRAPGHRALHQICQETVQLRASVSGTATTVS